MASATRAHKTPPMRKRASGALDAGTRGARARTFGGGGDGEAAGGVPAALLELELQRQLNIHCCAHADPLASEDRHLDQVVRASTLSLVVLSVSYFLSLLRTTFWLALLLLLLCCCCFFICLLSVCLWLSLPWSVSFSFLAQNFSLLNVHFHYID